MKIVKRDGRKEDYNSNKIIIAIKKAMKYGSGRYEPDIAKQIENEIFDVIKVTKTLTIFQIEDMVFHKLIEKGEVETAKEYESYRAVQEFKRKENTTDDSILGLLDFTNEEVMTENSNKNPIIASTQRDLIAGEVSKDIAKRKIIPYHLVQAHEKGLIHIHDLDYIIQPIFNCINENEYITIKNSENEVKKIKLYELDDLVDGIEYDKPNKISDIQILSRSGFVDLIAVLKRKPEEEEIEYNIISEYGSPFRATGKHLVPILRDDKELLLEVKDIEIGDSVIIYEEYDEYKLSEIIEIEKSILKDNVYDLQTGDEHFIVNDNVVHNCCLIDLKDMLKGTVVNDKQIDEPTTIDVASNVSTQIVAQIASNQYGGQTISKIDSVLAPYARKSYNKYLSKHQHRLNKIFKDTKSVDEIRELADKYADEDMRRTIKDSVQTIQYQINTLMTTNGQSPFLTLLLYFEEDYEYAYEASIIQEEILKQRLEGMKNKDGAWVTPAFPDIKYRGK